jgi:nitroreductase
MQLKELVRKSRTVRRYRQDQAVSLQTLRDLVDLARLTPSGRNAQPLKYLLSCTPEKNALIFQHLAWAAYLKDWDGPAEGERPAAYIVILGDHNLHNSFGVDSGIVSQTILLGAVEQGLSGCIIASIQRQPLAQALKLPDHLEILLVLTLGAPGETVVIDPLPADGDIRYWRDDAGVHHVPKRALDDLILQDF